MAKKTSRKAGRRAPKRAPLAVGGKKGSAGGDPVVLARLEMDALAAVDDLELALKRFRGRIEELQAERNAAQSCAEALLISPKVPTRIQND
jgi:hypothetical protein